MLKGVFLGDVKSAREIKTRICPNLRFKEPTMHDIIFLVLWYPKIITCELRAYKTQISACRFLRLELVGV